MEQMLPSSLRRRPSSPVNIDATERGTRDRQRLATLAKQLGMSSGMHCLRVMLLFYCKWLVM